MKNQQSIITLVSSWVVKERFFLVCLALLFLMVSHTINGQWVADFWEYSAVVRELATNPLSPRHPQLLVDAPHAFCSPYLLGVAWLSRLTQLDSVTILSICGIVNLLLLLFGLRLFVSLLFPRYGEATAFYTLLFTLLLWGSYAWDCSAFFHLKVLGYVLPYPATFSTALVLIALSIYLVLERSKNRLWVIPIGAISMVVLLTHPVSYVFLAVGLVALWLGTGPRFLSDIWVLLLIFVASFLAAALWPYYPFFKLLLSESSLYHLGSKVMYAVTLQRIFPALIGIPFLIHIMRSNSRHPLGLMFMLFCLVFIYGAISHKWSYGRIISHIVLTLHIAMAAGIAEIEGNLKWHRLSLPVQKLLFSSLIVIICLGVSFHSMLMPALGRYLPGRQNSYHELLFLPDFVNQYDVVLSDMETSWLVPTFGGKIVAAQHPLAFVPDHEQRIRDVNYFFSNGTSHQDRLQIIRKYGVNFLLINKHRLSRWRAVKESFLPLGQAVFEDSKFVLLSLNLPNIEGKTGQTSIWRQANAAISRMISQGGSLINRKGINQSKAVQLSVVKVAAGVFQAGDIITKVLPVPGMNRLKI